MKLRTRLLVFLAVLHLAVAVLIFLLYPDNAVLFIAAEVVLLGSFLTGWRWVNRISEPLHLADIGAGLIAEGDSTTKFVEVGQPEVDRLVRIYNSMIDRFRDERVRLEEQNLFLHQVVDQSPSGIAIFGVDGNIDRINPAAEQMLGIGRADAAGKSLAEVGGSLAEAIRQLPMDGARIVAPQAGTRLRIRKSKFIDRGAPRAFVTMEELTDEIRRSERDAYEKLIRTLSHEANNSLAAIRSLLESARTYGPQVGERDRPDFSTALDISIERSQHLESFMKRYAEVVRIPVPQKRPADLVELLRQVERFLHAECRRRSIDWQWDLGAGSCPVDLDRDQMEQVLLNILKNAVEAIGERGTISVRLSLKGRIELAVEDTGSGIDPAVREKLFTPFFSTKEGGQGVGLTLAAEVLRNHGFRYTLESEPGKPTRFLIWF